MDMDGTFLRDDKTFDEPRFQKQLDEMNARHIHFVVSSGNQFLHLKEIFKDIHGKISYIAENGAFVMTGRDEKLEQSFIKPNVLKRFVHELETNSIFAGGNHILSGEHGAYIPDNESAEDIKNAKYYYQDLHIVHNLENVDDNIYKISLGWDSDDVSTQMRFIDQQFKGLLRGTSSGRGGIDVLNDGISKANGMEIFRKHWNLTRDNMAAFGDSGNDIEMLKACKYGIAMKNAAPEVKAIVNYETVHDNEHDGTLDTIDRILKGEPLHRIEH
ncbi:HAD superfamily hydrolase [Lactobacillus selangorensis]|uniref:HAD superfamily hydrolase n=2 Tax=Lactobacillus selangorensis TaxID=81857 RepID=A0A0R2FVY3_9LACO|nr:HAD superfamily hydrolase [Lactobacillus selangorensis]KRN30043.1 HAD superfamily hydrolase [Lactobacillus selangorensis]